MAWLHSQMDDVAKLLQCAQAHDQACQVYYILPFPAKNNVM